MKEEVISAKRLAVLHKAAELFAQKGYKATTLRDLAASLNLEAASLYNHISSKQDILASLLLQLAKKYQIGIDEVLASGYSAREKLEKIIQLHIELTLKYPQVSKLSVYEWRHLDEPHLAAFLKLRRQYESKFKSLVIDNQKEGFLESIDTDIAWRCMLSSVRWIYDANLFGQNENKVELARQIKSFIFR